MISFDFLLLELTHTVLHWLLCILLKFQFSHSVTYLEVSVGQKQTLMSRGQSTKAGQGKLREKRSYFTNVGLVTSDH